MSDTPNVDFWTPVGRILYVDRVTKPEVKKDLATGKEWNKFSAKMVFDKARFSEVDKTLWAALLNRLNVLAQANWGTEWGKLPVNIKRGLRDGADHAGKPLCGEGTRFLNASSGYPPMLLTPTNPPVQMEPNSQEATTYIYDGAYCRMKVRPQKFLDQNTKNTGINFMFLAAQFFPGAERVILRAPHNDAPADESWLERTLDSTIEDETLGF